MVMSISQYFLSNYLYRQFKGNIRYLWQYECVRTAWIMLFLVMLQNEMLGEWRSVCI